MPRWRRSESGVGGQHEHLDGCQASGREPLSARLHIHPLKEVPVTKAQQVFERINELVEGGATKADAFRILSEKLGQSVKSLQGSYYTHHRKANGGSSRPRKRETTTADAIESATAVLVRALEAIDTEIAAAKERAEEAKAEYDALKGSASDRKQAIQAKIDTLNT
jgi:hypothetical protein